MRFPRSYLLVGVAALAVVALGIFLLPPETHNCTLPAGRYTLRITSHPVLPITHAELFALPGVGLPPGTPRHLRVSSEEELAELATSLLPPSADPTTAEFRSIEFWQLHCPATAPIN